MATPDWSAVAALAPPYSVDERAGKGRRTEYMRRQTASESKLDTLGQPQLRY